MEKSYPQALDTSDRRVSPWWVFAQKSAQWRHALGLQEAHKAGHEARRTAQTTIPNTRSGPAQKDSCLPSEDTRARTPAPMPGRGGGDVAGGT